MGQYLYELEVRAKIEDIDLKFWEQEMKKYEVNNVQNEILYLLKKKKKKNLDFEFINYYRRNN